MNRIDKLHSVKTIDKDLNLGKKYQSGMSWINLERADDFKDWVTFKKIWSKSPEIFTMHLLMSCLVFDYKILNEVKLYDLIHRLDEEDIIKIQPIAQKRIEKFLTDF